MTAPAITVCGAGRVVDPAVAALAREVGAAIVRSGCTLVCGGMDGVMHAACMGAVEARTLAGGHGGLIVGITPTACKADANPYCDVVIPTGLGVARNSLVVLAGDAVILVGGGAGTLSEAAFAWQLGRPIVALVPSGGWAASLAGQSIDDRRADWIVAAQSPAEAVARALELVHAAAAHL
ncbi:MAG TPA: TIGR00725 family protein [Polyangia bacterium]|jgi:hypothetical protein